MPASRLFVASSAKPLCSCAAGALALPLNAVQHLVIIADCIRVVLLLVGDLAQIELRSPGQIVQRIEVHHVLELSGAT